MACAKPGCRKGRRKRIEGARARHDLPSCKSRLARTLGLEHAEAGAVRSSSLADWPVYPRLRGTMQLSNGTRNVDDATTLLDMLPSHRVGLPLQEFDKPRLSAPDYLLIERGD
jgi:hypothetical protein